VRAVGRIESEVRTWVAMRIAESRTSLRHSV
jgi:predicted DNA-binding transcriptional regulator AlpA